MLDSRLLRGVVFCGIATVLGGAVVAAEPYEPKTELGFLFGATLPDRELTGDPDDFGPWGPSVGVRFAHRFGDSFNWFGDATASRHGDNHLASGDVKIGDIRTGVELFMGRSWGGRWFVQGAGGWAKVNYGTSVLDFDQPMVSAGFGQRWLLDRAGFWRWEARVNRLVAQDALNGADIANVQVLLGWAMPLGGPPPDEDADGVTDKADRCPGTPRGAVVDANGCPSDADGDGVFDGLDRCPNTPRGAKVDAGGCPVDTDGDGVFDGIDRCANTPRGAVVDATGCPKDADGDGVFDGIDRCPDTPAGAKVDPTGCPLDSDGDGVWDGIDRCPGTPKGTQIDATGCPIALAPPPKVESPFIPAPKAPVVLKGVNFATDSAILTDESRAILDQVATSLKANPDVKVEVAGHTDASGSDRHNQVLSQYRAETVRDYLVGAGVPASQIEAKGYGEAEPIDTNNTAAGKARNRRVELRRL